jgi:dihydrofolate reductase
MASPLTLIGIVAMTSERVIGRDNALPWHLPEDLAFFKKTTSGHAIIMGRKTFDSIGRPLPKRQNIVLTRDRSWSHPGVTVIHDPSEIASAVSQPGPAYIIGGAEIYSALLPQLSSLIVTHVKQNHPGDALFPEFAQEFPHSQILENHPAFTIRHHTRE